MNLSGARVWLTGASSGIGEALVGPLVARGASVAISARRVSLLESIAARHRGPSGARVIVVPVDVTDRAGVAAAAQSVIQTLGGIDLAIFNAGGRTFGTAGQEGATGARCGFDGGVFNADPYVATMALNYFSVVYGVEAVLPGMLERHSGRIAAVASIAGYRATPMAGYYGSSKAAVILLLDALRFTVKPLGVGVTTINPGYVRTPLTSANHFWMPFLLEPDKAAERILRGLERDREEIHFPRGLSWTAKLLRILPYPIYERLMTLFASQAGV
jgi:NAD(P)-dependent dehydrogenase (short-subunit alcohol dehydrogenase family)